MKVVFFQDWETPEERLMGTTEILRQLANLAARPRRRLSAVEPQMGKRATHPPRCKPTGARMRAR